MVITLARSLAGSLTASQPRCLAASQSRCLVVSRGVTYVVSRGGHVRRLSRRSRTLSLGAITYVVSRVELAPETWLRMHGVMCTVRAYCFVTDFSMADVLSFAFEVGCESFFGQILMHLCVHLHPRGCTCVHSGTGTGAGMNVHSLFFTFFVWRPFCLLPSSCILILSIRSPFWISLEEDSKQVFILSESHVVYRSLS